MDPKTLAFHSSSSSSTTSLLFLTLEEEALAFLEVGLSDFGGARWRKKIVSSQQMNRKVNLFTLRFLEEDSLPSSSSAVPSAISISSFCWIKLSQES